MEPSRMWELPGPSFVQESHFYMLLLAQTPQLFFNGTEITCFGTLSAFHVEFSPL
jgi:hypothetical protein